MDSSLVRTCPGIGRPCDRTVPHNPHDTRTISDRGIRRTLAIGHSTGMVELFHMPVGPGRHDHMLHAISRPRSQKTAMMMITPIVFPPCIGDSRSLCRSFHMHHVRYRYGGDCEGVWRVEPVFLFRFRTSLDGRHEGRRDMRSAKGGKNGRNRFGKPLYGFPSSCSGRL